MLEFYSEHKKTKEELKMLYQNIMKFLDNYIKNYQVKFCLFYGSLLGYSREESFIEKDDDIDVIIDNKYLTSLQKYCKNNSTKYNITIGINRNGILQLFYKNIGPFDIYFYKDVPNTNNIYLEWENNVMFDKNDLFELKKIKLYDFDIYIPKNNEQILTEIYGNDWRIPISRQEYDRENANINKLKFYKESFKNSNNSKRTKNSNIVYYIIIILLAILELFLILKIFYII
jgi:phosphorylcholine metabolism protein LicD